MEVNEDTKKAQREMFLEYLPYIIIILAVIFIRTFIATPVRVNGTSMDPTLNDGDIMILYKLTKNESFRGLKRFDIVVLKSNSGKLIKRIIGLPGEIIQYKLEVIDGENVGTLLIDGEEVKQDFLSNEAIVNTCRENWDFCSDGVVIPKGYYFVMGDNRGNSKDSRILGPIKKEDILGTTKLIVFPFSRFGNVK